MSSQLTWSVSEKTGSSNFGVCLKLSIIASMMVPNSWYTLFYFEEIDRSSRPYKTMVTSYSAFVCRQRVVDTLLLAITCKVPFALNVSSTMPSYHWQTSNSQQWKVLGKDTSSKDDWSPVASTMSLESLPNSSRGNRCCHALLTAVSPLQAQRFLGKSDAYFRVRCSIHCGWIFVRIELFFLRIIE